jgi:hypothetical protein
LPGGTIRAVVVAWRKPSAARSRAIDRLIAASILAPGMKACSCAIRSESL